MEEELLGLRRRNLEEGYTCSIAQLANSGEVSIGNINSHQARKGTVSECPNATDLERLLQGFPQRQSGQLQFCFRRLHGELRTLCARHEQQLRVCQNLEVKTAAREAEDA